MATDNSELGLGENAAQRLRTFAALYVTYLGSLVLLLTWVAISTAYFNGDWRVTLYFNEWGEGLAELVVLTLVVSVLPLGWMGLHESLRRS
jgi:archaellum biogenesis protein FlaJ (TadC family)